MSVFYGARHLTCVRVLSTDLTEPITWTFVRGVEDVWPQQRLQRGADGHQQQFGMKVTSSSCRCCRQFTQRGLHSYNTRCQDLKWTTIPQWREQLLTNDKISMHFLPPTTTSQFITSPLVLHVKQQCKNILKQT